MPAGIPIDVEKFTSLFPRLPDSAVTFITRTYMRYSRLYTKLVTWYHYGRKYDAPIEPFELYHVSPDKIQCQHEEKVGTTWECSVKDGGWDTNVTEFEDENLVHKSFRQRFVQDKEWTATEIYSNGKQELESDGAWGECELENEIIERLSSYDRLYQEIKEEGYRTQRQLREASDTDELQDKRYHPPEFSEVSVDVGCNGQLIWYGGQHRISIAKILGVDTIPVRVRIRHKKWQEYRDEVWNDPSKDASWHPDLQQPD